MKSSPKDASATSGPKDDFWWGFLFCTLCGAAFIVQMLRCSRLKPLWIDEVYTFYQVDGKSLSEMLASLKTGVNLLPPLYFVCLTVALRFFKFSPLLARALSGGFIVATIPVLWSVLRRNVGAMISTMAIASVLFGSYETFFHNSEARPYGLYFFCASLVLWGFNEVSQKRDRSGWTLVLVAAANALLPSANYFGGLYSALSLAVILYFDWRSGRPRVSVYIAYMIGWAIFAISVLPLCFAQYKSHGAAGTSWLPGPFDAFRFLLGEWIRAYRIGIVFSLASFILVFLFGKKRARDGFAVEKNHTAFTPQFQLLVLGLAWSALPLFVVLQSVITGKNLYFGRYFFASDLGNVLLVALALSYGCKRLVDARTFEKVAMSKKGRFTCVLFIAGFTVYVAYHFARQRYIPVFAETSLVQQARAWPNRPQVTFSIDYYTESLFHPTPGMPSILINQNAAERENVQRFDPRFHAVDLDALLLQSEFLFIDSYQTPKSFQLATWAADHGYSTQKVGEYTLFNAQYDFTIVRSLKITNGLAEKKVIPRTLPTS